MMKIGDHALSERVLIIAEIGNNHEGDYGRAVEMVHAAADAGADAVKFQTFRTEHYVQSSMKERFAMLRSFELSEDELHQLQRLAHESGMLFISTPFDLFSVDTLAPLVDAFKISSGDNTFYPLIEKVARQGRPVILSCGLAQVAQLAFAKALIERTCRDMGIRADMAFLHCVTSYPVPPEAANIARIRLLARELGGVVGYSDHTLGNEAAVCAVACGARIIEKHFTLDNNLSAFRDHQLSATPDQLRDLVKRIRETELLLGAGGEVLHPSEGANETAVRRSIVAARDLAAGDVVGLKDITWVRPAGGLAPGMENVLLGRRLIAGVCGGEWITPDKLEPEA
jgi:sialic acid synthase SpsE